jgi:hypothetical protein
VIGPDGRFEFRDLAPGTYNVSATLPPGLALVGPPLRSITLNNPSECSQVWFGSRTDSRISGALFDARGRPLVDEPVDLIAAVNASSTARTVRAVSVRTGADARFEFAFVATGEYVVGFNLKAPPSLSQLDRRVAAAPVTVAGESRIDIGALRLPEWPSERLISGVVVADDGTPAADARLTMFGAAPQNVPLDANGRFEVRLPYGARFELKAERTRIMPTRRTTERAAHVVGRDDRDADLTLTLGVSR